MSEFKLIFERSHEGRRGYDVPKSEFDTPIEKILGSNLLREQKATLPELSEVDVIRHYTALSKRNFGVDSGFYPLGSCTMKYNPKINEKICRLDGFSSIHPLQDSSTVQGAIQVIYDMQEALKEIIGFDAVSMQPAAGAHGELACMMMFKNYFEDIGQTQRTEIIIPDNAHGTNPASAALAGFDVVGIKSKENGHVDLEELKRVVSDKTAGIMMTNPNTLGIYEDDILKAAEIVHKAGGLLYYDGANANAILGKVRPGDMGFDCAHLNLHKTFSTPHGGGGPGSGPIGVKGFLAPYLPKPVATFENGIYSFDFGTEKSIGRVKAFYGNFAVILRAYTYILKMGSQGLKEASELAVLNANYLMEKLKPYYDIPYNTSNTCMHEFVICADKQKENGVSAADIAKRMIDYNLHPPTIYFPLIVHEAMMIEPTETQSKQELDEFVEIMIQIAKEAQDTPEIVQNAPTNSPVSRLDETLAARKPILKYE